MDIIELEQWKPSEANPHKLEYAGQPVAQEVFEELKHRLEGMGYLPDEYFLLDDHWKDGREIPKDADIFCTTDYGASERLQPDPLWRGWRRQRLRRVGCALHRRGRLLLPHRGELAERGHLGVRQPP